MAGMDKLNVSIPVSGEVLLRVNGVEGLHPVGTFEQNIPLTFSASAGEVSFSFATKLWEEAIRNKGVAPPTPTIPNPDLSTDSLVREVLEEHLEAFPDALASKIVEYLGREGRLAW